MNDHHNPDDIIDMAEASDGQPAEHSAEHHHHPGGWRARHLTYYTGAATLYGYGAGMAMARADMVTQRTMAGIAAVRWERLVFASRPSGVIALWCSAFADRGRPDRSGGFAYFKTAPVPTGLSAIDLPRLPRDDARPVILNDPNSSGTQ